MELKIGEKTITAVTDGIESLLRENLAKIQEGFENAMETADAEDKKTKYGISVKVRLIPSPAGISVDISLSCPIETLTAGMETPPIDENQPEMEFEFKKDV